MGLSLYCDAGLTVCESKCTVVESDALPQPLVASPKANEAIQSNIIAQAVREIGSCGLY